MKSYKLRFGRTSFLEILRIHRRNNKFLKLFRDRNQSIIDHNIFGVDGINMIHIYDIRFVGPVPK